MTLAQSHGDGLAMVAKCRRNLVRVTLRSVAGNHLATAANVVDSAVFLSFSEIQFMLASRCSLNSIFVCSNENKHRSSAFSVGRRRSSSNSCWDGPPPSQGNPPEAIEFFEKKIRPILVNHCYECHSMASKKTKGGLSLDTRDGLLEGRSTPAPRWCLGIRRKACSSVRCGRRTKNCRCRRSRSSRTRRSPTWPPG